MAALLPTQPPSRFVRCYWLVVAIVVAVFALSAAMFALVLFPFALTASTLLYFDLKARKNVDALAQAADTGRPSGLVSYSTLLWTERP